LVWGERRSKEGERIRIRKVKQKKEEAAIDNDGWMDDVCVEVEGRRREEHWEGATGRRACISLQIALKH
jgi:hypothetical protein